ncbi:MAG: cytochrome c1 [Rhodospirillales bacterium]|nr:cytochrome c1 [Rhodospirillales bacterium]MCB9980223.1 cytochrome c1 [Rhodospirillales bacterium]
MIRTFKKIALVSVFGLMISGTSPVAQAATGEEPPHQSWSFEGPFGTYDKAALQRGFLVYKQVCSACHSMQKMHYRNLDGLGYNEDQIKTIASEFMVEDGPNDEGEFFERAARPADTFKSPFKNKKEAAYANNGIAPPDLSLMAFARHGGADYVYALLSQGYQPPPAGEHHLADGQYYNIYKAGHIIAMAPPLSDGQVSYPDGSLETKEQYAHDVAQFLQYVADPKMEMRKEIGLRAMIFLFFLTLVFFIAKKKIWKKVH